MANGFLTPFLTGALTELQEQKRVSDEIAGSVVDNVSKHILGVEIPQEKAIIKAQEDLKKTYASTYDQKVADGMDAMGGYVSSEQKSQFAEFLSHNSFDGKRAETKKWWDKIKTSHDADNALDKMAKNIESFKINETLDEQMQNSINKENA